MKPYFALAAIGSLAFISAATFHSPEKKAKKVMTYAENVAPILNGRCVSCHRPGEVAPFSLIGYDNAKKWSDMVLKATEQKVMPPWKAVHGYGEFKDSTLLTSDEIQTLKDWNSSGSPRGDKKKEPVAPSFSGDWSIGAPDKVLQISKPYELAAEGEDVYRNYVFHMDNKEPIWVTAMDVKPGNKKIVHHVIAFIGYGNKVDRTVERMKKADDTQEGYTSSGGGVGFLPDNSLGGWAPGIRPRSTPDGTAFLLKPNATVVMQVHYHKTGKPEVDQTKIGLYYAKAPVQKEMLLNWVFNFTLNIQPGDKEYKISQTKTFPQDVTLYGVMPHMHLLGKKMKSWLEFPDGTIKPLIQVDDWDFNWQLNYVFKEPIFAPKGTKQIVEAVYDNSATNPRNPSNPPKPVYFGEQTTDEMFLMIGAYTVGKP